MVILPRLKRLVGPLVTGLRAGFLQWTRPLTSSLPLQTLADLGRSKSELVAENALLRQQLIILRRQVKRPACTKTDRVLLVLLARMVRTWKQTLFIVQPETLLGFHRELFRLVWKHKSKASSHQPKVAAQTIALPQANGEGQSALGRREDSRRTPETGHPCLQTNHSEIHEDGSHKASTRPDVGDLSAQPRRSGLGVRLPPGH